MHLVFDPVIGHRRLNFKNQKVSKNKKPADEQRGFAKNKSLAARKATLALILIASPVIGLPPIRAARLHQ